MVDKKKGDAPKRYITEHERMHTPAYAIKLGMYVDELDRPWDQTPFLFQGFVLETQEQIDTIQSICDYVYIDIARSVEIRTTKPGLSPSPPKAKRHAYPLPSVSAAAEYEVAVNHYEGGLTLSKDFMTGVAEKKPIQIEAVKESVSDCIDSILRNPDAMLWLSKIRNEDEYTSEHCFNVCILALIFGRHLGMQGDELINLGICGMLHDVGKMSIPADILNKPGSLNKVEFQIMRTHTEHGRETLQAQENMLLEAIEVAHSHHETFDGKGYPRGLSGENISEFSRIICICDVYDAITSDRVYKKAQSSLEAFKVLYENRDSKFDPNLVLKFIECVGLYPPGSIVELASGEVAIVLATNYAQRRFPKIMIVLDQNKKLCQETIVDLSALAKSKNVEPYRIKATIPNGSFGIRLEEYIKKGLKVG